jgi:hypothetical protein
VNFSFESAEDIVELAAEVGKMFADAKLNLEGAAFATGGGSTDPKGVVTAVTAVTASRVSPTTGGAFALPIYIGSERVAGPVQCWRGVVGVVDGDQPGATFR